MNSSFFATAVGSPVYFVLAMSCITLAPVAQAQSSIKHVFSNPNPASKDYFGVSVALEGDFALVGSSGDDTLALDAGRAFLFDAVSGGLLHSLSDPSPAAGAGFGEAVAISGNLIVVGAPDTSVEGPGRAFVFDAVSGNLLQTLENPEPAADDKFGWRVAIEGNDVLVGALLDDSIVRNGGQAFLFDATTGNLVRSFRDPTPAVGDFFGADVALQGNTVVISASSDNTNALDAGQVLIFDRDTGNLRHTLDSPQPGIADRFGNSVAISGDKLVVGELRDDVDGPYSGIAHIFDPVSGNWLRTFRDPVPPTRSELFGAEVEISGDLVFVGTNPNIRGFDQRGHVFAFHAATGELLHTFEDSTNTGFYSSFSRGISVSGDQILIGAPGNFAGPSGPGLAMLYDFAIPEPRSAAMISVAVLVGCFTYRRRLDDERPESHVDVTT